MTDVVWMLIWLGSTLAGFVSLVILAGWHNSLRVITPATQQTRDLVVCLCFLGIFGGGTLAILQWISYAMHHDGIAYSVLSEGGIFIAGTTWVIAFASWKSGGWHKVISRYFLWQDQRQHPYLSKYRYHW